MWHVSLRGILCIKKPQTKLFQLLNRDANQLPCFHPGFEEKKRKKNREREREKKEKETESTEQDIEEGETERKKTKRAQE